MFDRVLQERIQAALAADPHVDDDEIAVECFEGGNVVLRGRAATPIKRAQAVRTVRQVPGVRTVDDRMQPRPGGDGDREDARTEAAVLSAFIADGALPAETIDAQAFDGTVTLRGIVDLPYQREEAEQVAMGVPGVSEVRNHLKVWMAVSVDEVAKRVRKAIGKDAIVGADRLTVTAHDNVVRLSGTVRSTADRDAAIAAAADTTAVADVDDDIRVLSTTNHD